MLIANNDAVLLTIDVQEKLLPAMSDPELTLKRISWLMSVASELSIPVVISEQYPRGLGSTIPSLLLCAPHAHLVEKVHFSCVKANCIPDEVLTRQQFVLCGIESHICVLQTALDLKALGKTVFVVIDAIDSRHPSSHLAALERMRACGIQLVTREMFAFEALQSAGNEKFKLISKTYLAGDQPI